MAKKENKYEGYGISTQSIHTGTDYDEETGAVRRPLHMANSYKLPDDLAQVNYSSTDLLMYTRNGMPISIGLRRRSLHCTKRTMPLCLQAGLLPCMRFSGLY